MRYIINKLRDAGVVLKHAFRKGGADHIALGKMGEDLAINRLKSMGYKILKRNARISGVEVDIIARDGTLLVFVEVKTRSSHSFGAPLESVTGKKAARLKKAAQIYCQHMRTGDVSVRFDVVSVDYQNSIFPYVSIIQGAF